MAAKKDPATLLAEKMLQVLEAQRGLGPDCYPLTLGRLAELSDPAAAPELVRKAAAKRKPFGERAVVIAAKNLDAPVALLEDAELLADSTLLLEFLLASLCSAAQPTCDLTQLKSKVPAKLRRAFGTALDRRLAENRLPPGVGIVRVGRKRSLHLQRYPLRRPPEEVLAEDLLRRLQEQRRLGPDAYPLTLAQLVELTRPGADAKLVRKAVAQPAFEGAAVRAMTNKPETPVALKGDEELLAGSSLLLESAFRLARARGQGAYALSDLTRPVIRALQKPMEQAVRRRLETRSLPAGIGGVFYQKTRPLFFLLTDVLTGPTEQPAASAAREQQPGAPSLAPSPWMGEGWGGGEERIPPLSPSPTGGEGTGHPHRGRVAGTEAPVPSAAGEPSAEFAQAFDAAFERLDRQRGSHNAVSLVDLRRALAVDRQTFDAELGHLRRSRRYTLSSAEGRHGISPEEREAGIYEDGSLLLYISRKRS